MSPSQDRDALLTKRVRQFTRMLQGLERGDVQALHKTRVATRRLREILPVLQLPVERGDKLSRRLRKVTAALGPVRELDVLTQLIDELRAAGVDGRTALTLVASDITKERQTRRRALGKRLPSKMLRRLAGQLEAVSDELHSRGSTRAARRFAAERAWHWAVEARVAKRAAALRAAIEKAGAVYIPERLHDVRIAAKKLRYAVESAADIGVRAAHGDVRTLRSLQDVLGRLHDLQRLIDRVRQIQASLAPPSLVGWRGLENIVDRLENDCRLLHGRYMRKREGMLALCLRLTGRRPSTARRVTA